ncbi:unannotated protein [freshwater metagenome]|uniref:Unannotated protein n=1 Tax=freshwater metagenome TaxID=449393 RepID=A0A6J7JJX8_9ZZZZ
MNTKASRFVFTRAAASESYEAAPPFQSTVPPMWPPCFNQAFLNALARPVPNELLIAPTVTHAVGLYAVEIAFTSACACNKSEGYVRNKVSLSLNVVSAGDDAAEAIASVPVDAAVTAPIASDAPEVSDPTMKLTLSDLTSFVAASVATDGASETESS